MDSQSSQSARRANAGETGHESTCALPSPQQFRWTGQDISDAGKIAVALGSLRQREHSDAILETNIELQCRDPRPLDAWRFFHAARQLRHAFPAYAVIARSLGQKIGAAAIHVEVIDAVHVRAGTSEAIVFALPMGAR